MANDKFGHPEFGMLDRRKADLGRPDLPGLWDRLRADKRIPMSDRGLYCGEVCLRAGHVEPMYVYERGGLRIVAHQRSEGEARHNGVSEEHLAYQERACLAAEADGFTAKMEVRTVDGKMRSDVLIIGADDLRIGWETQRSRQSAHVTLGRDRKATEHGITDVWHTDRRDLAEQNEVAWARTDNLPPEAIRDNRDLIIRSGVRSLHWDRCDDRIAIPCPDKRSGRCGGMHPTPEVLTPMFDDLVRGVAAGRFVRLALKQGRRTNHYWVPAADRDRLEDATGHLERELPETPRKPYAATKDSAPTCRPRIEVTRSCSGCGSPITLVDATGQPRCWTCRTSGSASGSVRMWLPVESVPSVAVAVATPAVPTAGQEGVCAYARRDGCPERARLYPCGWRCEMHKPISYSAALAAEAK